MSLFTRVELKTKEEEIVDQIRSLILRGRLRPGDKLPPERDLSKALGVGRHTLRVALNRLAALGFLEIIKNKGAFVKSVTPASLSDSLKDMLEREVRNMVSFLEIRKLLESWTASQAAEKATEEDLMNMERALDEMRSAIAKGESIARGDLAFHLAISAAADNTVMLHIMDAFVTLMHSTQRLRALATNPQTTPELMRQHEEIYKAMRERNPALAALL